MYNNRPGLKKSTFCYIKQQQSSQGRYQRADPESAADLCHGQILQFNW